jgi:hypothetical protein
MRAEASVIVILAASKSTLNVYSDVYSGAVEKALNCAPSGFRTPDPLIKSQLLYQLS